MDGFYHLHSTYLQGTGKVSYALLLSLLRQAVVPAACMLAAYGLAGLPGLVWSGPMTEVLCVGTGAWMCRRWQKWMPGEASHATALPETGAANRGLQGGQM